jgi:uncharacterized protein YecT (DUF1311 family)
MGEESMGRAYLAVFLVAATLSGCDAISSLGESSGECGSQDTKVLAIQVLTDGIEDQVASAKDEDGSVLSPRSKVRAALKQVVFALSDVRTTKSDPDSSRKFCSGNLSIKFSREMIDNAEEAHKLAKYTDPEQLALNLGFDREGGAYTIDVDYSVQPTDDNDKIYVELENTEPVLTLSSDILTSHLLLPRWRSEIGIQNAEAARLRKEQEDAAGEQQAASLEQARAEQKLAEQSINAVWQSLEPVTRDQLLDVQRAWIKRKTAECRLEGASQSTERNEQLAAVANCEARMNNEREEFLRGYLNYD